MRRRRDRRGISSEDEISSDDSARHRRPRTMGYRRMSPRFGSALDGLRNAVGSPEALTPAGRFEAEKSDIRGYVPGSLRACSSEASLRSDRLVASGQLPLRTRVAFVGEFGAGKSSLINTIWHVLTDETGAFHKVAHTAHGAQSATAQPRSIIYQPDVDDTRQGGTFTLWDTPGFKVFNEAELRVMEEYVETGIRERADVLGLVRGMDAGYPGDPACAVDHFVWVFGMKRLGAAVPEAEGARARSPARPRTGGGPQNATVSVTKKGLEFTKQGRELFWQFYSYACSRSGTAPTVVLTHVDQFTAAEVAEAKTLIQALTQVDVHDILTVTCYRSEYCPPPARPDTEFAAIHIMHTALARADTYRAPRRDHTVQRLSRAFSEMAHRFRVLVWHVQHAKYVCVCMILVVFVLAVFVVLKLANRHGQGDVVHMPAPPATFDVASP